MASNKPKKKKRPKDIVARGKIWVVRYQFGRWWSRSHRIVIKPNFAHLLRTKLAAKGVSFVVGSVESVRVNDDPRGIHFEVNLSPSRINRFRHAESDPRIVAYTWSRSWGFEKLLNQGREAGWRVFYA